MQFIDQHKALIITILITGILVFGMFSFHISKQNALTAETYYQLEPETLEELKELEKTKALEALAQSVKTTNKAYNEDEEFKEMMKNFKAINTNDFKQTTKTLDPETTDTKATDNVVTASSTYSISKGASVNQDQRAKYQKAKDILAKRSEEKRSKNQKGNTISTLTYSLKGRKLIDYNTPRYLCEDSGKIVVNITVNAQGYVTDAYINTASTSTNACLTESALEYAKSAVFDTASNPSQIGSITFYFKAK